MIRCVCRKKYLTSHPKCRSKAVMCQNECQRTQHCPDAHEKIEIDEFKTNINLRQEKKEKKVQEYLNKVKRVFEERSWALVSEFDQVKKKITTAKFFRQQFEYQRMFQLISNQRFEDLTCQDVYLLSQRNELQIDSILMPIVRRYQEGTISNEERFQKSSSSSIEEIPVEKIVLQRLRQHFQLRIFNEREKERVKMQAIMKKLNATLNYAKYLEQKSHQQEKLLLELNKAVSNKSLQRGQNSDDGQKKIVNKEAKDVEQRVEVETKTNENNAKKPIKTTNRSKNKKQSCEKVKKKRRSDKNNNKQKEGEISKPKSKKQCSNSKKGSCLSDETPVSNQSSGEVIEIAAPNRSKSRNQKRSVAEIQINEQPAQTLSLKEIREQQLQQKLMKEKRKKLFDAALNQLDKNFSIESRTAIQEKKMIINENDQKSTERNNVEYSEYFKFPFDSSEQKDSSG